MPTMTVKEWAAEYKAFNESQLAEKRETLPLRTIEDSVKTYFALCRLVAGLNSENENHREIQRRDYLKWEATIRQIARRQGIDLPR